MYENEYMYAIERDPAYLAHYGIKGMKWGVRKAIERGNDRALGRQYRKAQKKLAKLEKRAASGAKYARRAAALGAGAALAGGAAVAGTGGVSRAMGAVGGAAAGGAHRLGGLMSNSRNSRIRNAGAALQRGATGAAIGIGKSASALNKWGNQNTALQNLHRAGSAAQKASGIQGLGIRGFARSTQASLPTQMNVARYNAGHVMKKTATKLNAAGVNSNNALFRVGAGAVGAGLAGAAGYNAYRAATTKRAAKKAAQFRSEMNKAFKGTKYANGGGNRQGGKRRKSRRG